jgi:hypothetical protein
MPFIQRETPSGSFDAAGQPGVPKNAASAPRFYLVGAHGMEVGNV